MAPPGRLASIRAAAARFETIGGLTTHDTGRQHVIHAAQAEDRSLKRVQGPAAEVKFKLLAATTVAWAAPQSGRVEREEGS